MQRKDVQDKARLLVDKILAKPKIQKLATQIIEYDMELYKHSLNVAFITAQICYNEGFDRDKRYALTTAALLHDIGKIKLPKHILNKTTTLTPEEFSLIRHHVEYGTQILTEAGIDKRIINYVAMHHECTNGAGYPLGLSGKEMTSGGKILSAVDKYDALTAQRVYGNVYNTMEAINIIGGEGSAESKYLQYIVDCEAI